MKEGPIARGGQPVSSRVGRLSKGQLDCLRLVNEHLSSKEIAAELGISPHTVDQRVRGALQILGVARRSHAARLVAQEVGPYQRLIHQAPDIVPAPPASQQDEAVGHQIRHADRTGGTEGNGLISEQGTQSRSPLFLPIATRSHPENRMSVSLRLAWIVVIAIGLTFSAGMFLAGLESLSRMMTK